MNIRRDSRDPALKRPKEDVLRCPPARRGDHASAWGYRFGEADAIDWGDPAPNAVAPPPPALPTVEGCSAGSRALLGRVYHAQGCPSSYG